jgi:hypothetical protein
MTDKPPYQVWLNTTLLPKQREAKAYLSFPAGYHHFANVKADSLTQVVAVMNNSLSIFSPDFRQWEKDNGVQTFLPGVVARDIGRGDVIVTPAGQPYRYDGESFKRMSIQPDPARRARFQAQANGKDLAR